MISIDFEKEHKLIVEDRDHAKADSYEEKRKTKCENRSTTFRGTTCTLSAFPKGTQSALSFFMQQTMKTQEVNTVNKREWMKLNKKNQGSI